jgi:hypothetical protein
MKSSIELDRNNEYPHYRIYLGVKLCLKYEIMLN